MARCMLHEKNPPKQFLAKVTNITVFLHNRLPTKAPKNLTLLEAWYGYKPSPNLKVFHCLCFTNIPQVKRDKLDNKAI